MVKKLYFIIALFFVSSILSAQNYSYVPLPLDSSIYWNNTETQYFGMGTGQCSDFVFYISKDTLINGLIYGKLDVLGYEKSYNGWSCGAIQNRLEYNAGYLRNDTLNQKVYFLNPSNGINRDTLLYDFNLQLGDTLESYLTRGYKYVVESLDTILLGGQLRERYSIDDICLGSPHGKLIEGIGSTRGLLYDLGCSLCCFATLNCMSINGKTIYPDSTTTCDVVSSVSDFHKSTGNTLIYPNPFQEQITVQNEGNQNLVYRLFNSLGQEVVVQIQSVNNRTLLSVGDIPKGLYWLRVSDGKKEETFKLIRD